MSAAGEPGSLHSWWHDPADAWQRWQGRRHWLAGIGSHGQYKPVAADTAIAGPTHLHDTL